MKLEYFRRNKNAETRDRTGDLQIFSLTLSQLSYRGVIVWSEALVISDHGARVPLCGSSIRETYAIPIDSVAEWSKASDSSSDGAIRVGSNPTAVNFRTNQSTQYKHC